MEDMRPFLWRGFGAQAHASPVGLPVWLPMERGNMVFTIHSRELFWYSHSGEGVLEDEALTMDGLRRISGPGAGLFP